MGFLAKLLGVGDVVEGVGNVIDKFVETPEEKKAAEVLRTKIQQEPDRWQAEINKASASHRSLFVAGARPFIVWVCGLGFAMHVIINPILIWITGKPGPELDAAMIANTLFAVLGLGSLRSWEKYKGLTK